jgi:hypothetical protein
MAAGRSSPVVIASIFESKLASALHTHLEGIDLQPLSRIDASLLASKAIPNIASIELVNSNDFSKFYDALYIKSFPKRTEREPSHLIVSRLAAEFAGDRNGLAPYRIVGIRDTDNEAIGAAHFCILSLSGSEFAIPYLQYIYVRSENRRQYISEILHTMTLAVAMADAKAMGNRSVPFNLFETEPLGYGNDEEKRAFSTIRAQVHMKGGAVAIVLERYGEEISPHVQPGLEVGDPPISLVWTVRRSLVTGEEWKIGEIGEDLMSAYYQSIRDEGFLEENIRLAESMLEERCRGSMEAGTLG